LNDVSFTAQSSSQFVVETITATTCASVGGGDRL